MPAVDKSRLGEVLRPLGDEDVREVLSVVIEDIEGFLRRLDDIEALDELARRSLFHKIKGFASQFFMPECAEIAGAFLAARPNACALAARSLMEALERARAEFMTLESERATCPAAKSQVS